MASIMGMKVVTSKYMVEEDGKTPTTRIRKWPERLFEKTTLLDSHWRPVKRWAPWVKHFTYLKTVYKPSMELVVDTTKKVVFCHPAVLELLRKELPHAYDEQFGILGSLSGMLAGGSFSPIFDMPMPVIPDYADMERRILGLGHLHGPFLDDQSPFFINGIS